MIHRWERPRNSFVEQFAREYYSSRRWFKNYHVFNFYANPEDNRPDPETERVGGWLFSINSSHRLLLETLAKVHEEETCYVW